MKVYVLQGGWNYEGFNILGIYSTEQLAAQSRIRYRKLEEETGIRYDYYTIDAYELDEDNYDR